MTGKRSFIKGKEVFVMTDIKGLCIDMTAAESICHYEETFIWLSLLALRPLAAAWLLQGSMPLPSRLTVAHV